MEEMFREEDACLEKTQGSLRCLAATILLSEATWKACYTFALHRRELVS